MHIADVSVDHYGIAAVLRIRVGALRIRLTLQQYQILGLCRALLGAPKEDVFAEVNIDPPLRIPRDVFPSDQDMFEITAEVLHARKSAFKK